jgi:mRNA degradation ribonuclease J1/J2
LNTKIKGHLADFLYTQTKRRPMILPVVMEVLGSNKTEE